MRCIVCSNEIDETKQLDPKDSFGREKLAEAISQWIPVMLTAYVDGGNRVVASAYVCPDDAKSLDALAIGSSPVAAKGKKP